MKYTVRQFFSFSWFVVLLVVAGGAVGQVSQGGNHPHVAQEGSMLRVKAAFSCLKTSEPLSRRQGVEVLERVQAHYSSIKSMRGSFYQHSYVAALDEAEASSGAMTFSKPGKMRWSYKFPRIQEVIIRDGELWMYQPDKNQVMIDSIGAVLLSKLPVSFLMGLGNIAKSFELESACRSSTGVLLTLVPHKKTGKDDEQEALEGFVLLVEERKSTPTGAKITSVGGNTTAIIFENLQVNPAGGSEDKFVLDYPKGVDILDRRTNPGF